jgi:hypothetical protein
MTGLRLALIAGGADLAPVSCRCRPEQRMRAGAIEAELVRRLPCTAVTLAASWLARAWRVLTGGGRDPVPLSLFGATSYGGDGNELRIHSSS